MLHGAHVYDYGVQGVWLASLAHSLLVHANPPASLINKLSRDLTSLTT